jgi:hypothetical protein
MALPAALKNTMLPVHDAAGPLEGALARFTTAICAVSVLPNPTRNVRVTVALLCAMAAAARLMTAIAAATNRLNNIRSLLLWLGSMLGATPDQTWRS